MTPQREQGDSVPVPVGGSGPARKLPLLLGFRSLQDTHYTDGSMLSLTGPSFPPPLLLEEILLLFSPQSCKLRCTCNWFREHSYDVQKQKKIKGPHEDRASARPAQCSIKSSLFQIETAWPGAGWSLAGFSRIVPLTRSGAGTMGWVRVAGTSQAFLCSRRRL